MMLNICTVTPEINIITTFASGADAADTGGTGIGFKQPRRSQAFKDPVDRAGHRRGLAAGRCAHHAGSGMAPQPEWGHLEAAAK